MPLFIAHLCKLYLNNYSKEEMTGEMAICYLTKLSELLNYTNELGFDYIVIQNKP